MRTANSTRVLPKHGLDFKPIIKVVTFYGIVLISILLTNRYIAKTLFKIRGMFTNFPAEVVWPFYMFFSCLRTSLIIPWYIMPVRSFMVWYFVVTLGVSKGAFLMVCSWWLQSTIYIPLIRWLWTKRLDTILNEKESRWWFPDSLKIGVSTVDVWWAEWANSQAYWQGGLVYMLQTTFFMGGIVPQVWIATRTSIPYWVYTFALLVVNLTNYPFVKMVGQTMLDVTDDDKSNLLVDFFSTNFKGLLKMKWWEVLLCLVLPSLSTLFVHGHHLRILISWLISWNPNRTPSDEYSNDSEEVVGLLDRGTMTQNVLVWL